MVDEIYTFQLVVRNRGTSTAPFYDDLILPLRTVRRIEIVSPPGIRGHVGIALTYHGTFIFPSSQMTFFTGDNATIGFDANNLPTAGHWQAASYNSGIYWHTFEIRFYVDVIRAAAQSNSTPFIDASLLSG